MEEQATYGDRDFALFQPLPAAAAEEAYGLADLPPQSYWRLVLRRFLNHRLAVAGIVFWGVIILAAFIIPTLTGTMYRDTNLLYPYRGPSLLHPLGYNELGQDITVRLMKGAQVSVIVGLLAVAVMISLGMVVGAIAGYFGGLIDNVLMRVVDVILSIPFFLLVIAVVAILQRNSMWVVIIAIGATGWTTAARLVRAEFLRLRETTFVEAARALGVGNRRIIFRHILPNSLAPLIVAATLGIADSVVIEATLSYLGFGISPPEPSLGNMLTNAQDYFNRAPLFAVYPGVLIILLVLTISFVGDGLRDALDPRQEVVR